MTANKHTQKTIRLNFHGRIGETCPKVEIPATAKRYTHDGWDGVTFKCPKCGAFVGAHPEEGPV